MEAENRLTQWVKEKIEKEYREDIALLIGVTGHATNGDGHGECFDYYEMCIRDRRYCGGSGKRIT